MRKTSEHLICLIFLINLGIALHIDQPKAIYHDQDYIQQIIDGLIYESNDDQSGSNSVFEKKTCGNYNYLQVTPKNVSRKDTLKVMITCNIHAREILTSEICLKFIQELFKQNSISNENLGKDFSTLRLFSYRIFYIGNTQRQTALKKDHCIRKNKNGVDLNRNFPTEFNSYNQSEKSQIYSGPFPISEQYSQCIENLTNIQLPDLFLDFHTGDLSFFYQKSRPYQEQLDTQLALIQAILNSKEKLCSQCRVTTLQDDGELINGHIFADLKVRKKVKYSILIEAYKGNEKNRKRKEQKNQECFQLFNPTTERQKNLYLRKWVKIIKRILKYIKDQQRKAKNVSKTLKISKQGEKSQLK